MHSKGHLGLALLICSLIALPFGFGPDNYVLIIVLFTTGLSSIPDIDFNFEIKHRGFTHNILFAILCGVVFGSLFGYVSGLIWGIIGFIAGFGGVMLHLLGDVMTHMEFAPFYPFKKDKIAYRRFYSGNEKVNNGFFILGVIIFLLYIFIHSGAFANFL